MATETIADILREMREFADTDSQDIGRDVLRRKIQHFVERIEAVYRREVVTDCNGLNEDNDWRSQLMKLINGEVSHYMSQGVDYFSVAKGPWMIHYDQL